MRLCIVTPSFVGGGAERIAVNLANFFSSEGHDVSLLVFKAVGPYVDQVDPGVRLIDLDIRRTRYVFFRLRRALEVEQPTHVLSVIRGSNIVLGLLALLGKQFKLVFREASTMDALVGMPMLQRYGYRALMKIAYSRADRVIANSNDTKADLVDQQIATKHQVAVIGNPVLPSDYETLALEAPLHPWLVDGKHRTVLTVGRLHKLKNQAMLVEAFSKLSNCQDDLRLIILGDGQERDNLLELAQRLGVSEKIEIVPFLENPYPYYKNSDVFVLTSQWEGFGNVLVEAMACGTPVISTNCSGGPKTILCNGRFGTLVPVGDVDALAESILAKLNLGLENEAKKRQIERAHEFSVNVVAERYLREMV